MSERTIRSHERIAATDQQHASVVKVRDPHCRRTIEHRTMRVERRPVDRLFAGAACPGRVAASVTGARHVPDERKIGAERVTVHAARWRPDDPRARHGLYEVTDSRATDVVITTVAAHNCEPSQASSGVAAEFLAALFAREFLLFRWNRLRVLAFEAPHRHTRTRLGGDRLRLRRLRHDRREQWDDRMALPTLKVRLAGVDVLHCIPPRALDRAHTTRSGWSPGFSAATMMMPIMPRRAPKKSGPTRLLFLRLAITMQIAIQASQMTINKPISPSPQFRARCQWCSSVHQPVDVDVGATGCSPPPPDVGAVIATLTPPENAESCSSTWAGIVPGGTSNAALA